MERRVGAQFNTQIYEEACEWFIACRTGGLDTAARVELDLWLRKSPEHQSAYLEIAAIWNEAPTLDPTNRWNLDTLIDQAAEDPSNVVTLNRAARPSNVFPTVEVGDRGGGKTVGRRRMIALAASVLLATALMASYFHLRSEVYTTGVGEQRSLSLADGSTVELNALSKIRIEYSKHEREIELLEGQALFRVAKDVSRPFIVRSGDTLVRAVGTQFDVYRKASGTVVTVVEGRVAILERTRNPGPGSLRSGTEGHLPSSAAGSAADRARAGSILLAAGEQITVSPRAVSKAMRPNIAGATAWTQRQLVFDSASLTEVAEEFNRYNERKLVIDPSAADGIHISGVFLSTNPTSLIYFLRDHPSLRVTEDSTEIRVEKQH